MPRSTTAWLMASPSVACSAISPNQMKIRLIALNIALSLLNLLFLFLLQENLLLEDEFQLLAKLLLIGGTHDGDPHLLQGRKDLGIDVERHKMDEDHATLRLGRLVDPWNHHDRIGAR